MKNCELDNSISKLSCSWLGDGLQDVMRSVFLWLVIKLLEVYYGCTEKAFSLVFPPFHMIVHHSHGSIKNMLTLQSVSLLGATFHTVEKAKMTSQITMKIN